jgi:hypothetical protein
VGHGRQASRAAFNVDNTLCQKYPLITATVVVIIHFASSSAAGILRLSTAVEKPVENYVLPFVYAF